MLTPSVLEVDGVQLRQAEPDPKLLLELSRTAENAGMLGASLNGLAVAQAFLEGAAMELWSTPMTCWAGGQPQGLLFNVQTDVGSLNTRIVALLRDPLAHRQALALYARHLLWSYPLHRLYAEVPVTSSRWRDAFGATGFIEEGRLIEHTLLAGERHDVIVFGMLRRDFERWSAAEGGTLAIGDRA